jgi:hypothetical protein
MHAAEVLNTEEAGASQCPNRTIPFRRPSVAGRSAPGLTAVESLTLESPTHAGLAVFGDLPRVTPSELTLDLEGLR